MIKFTILGLGDYSLEHRVMDAHGTQAMDGRLSTSLGAMHRGSGSHKIGMYGDRHSG